MESEWKIDTSNSDYVHDGRAVRWMREALNLNEIYGGALMLFDVKTNKIL